VQFLSILSIVACHFIDVVRNQRMTLRKAGAEDLDMDQLAETELSRLQRQYRIMEGDRQSYSQEANTIIQKQRFKRHIEYPKTTTFVGVMLYSLVIRYRCLRGTGCLHFWGSGF